MLFSEFSSASYWLNPGGVFDSRGQDSLTGILGWKNPPAPISLALDAGRNKLIQVLGIQDQIPSSLAKENTTVTGAVELLQSLNPADIKKVKTIFCQQ